MIAPVTSGTTPITPSSYVRRNGRRLGLDGAHHAFSAVDALISMCSGWVSAQSADGTKIMLVPWSPRHRAVPEVDELQAQRRRMTGCSLSPNAVENDKKSGLEGVVPDRFAVNQGSTTFSCRSHRRLSIVVVVGMYSRET